LFIFFQIYKSEKKNLNKKMLKKGEKTHDKKIPREGGGGGEFFTLLINLE